MRGRQALSLWTVLIAGSAALGCGPVSGERARQYGFAGTPRAPDFVRVARDLKPAVVSVAATMPEAATAPGGSSESEGGTTERSFALPPPARPPSQRSQGSGFIIDANGTILTNAHIIEGASQVIVKLPNRREYEARVIGRDLPTDVAVIKISANEQLPTLKLGDSDRLEVGEWVMAVGNPFGLDNSVSSGIVSAKGRHIGEPYDRLIQTDASINPGSSGGPLVNLDGRVVGVNKAIITQKGGGSVGISFATPINLIKEILPQLQTRGKVTRGWAGVALQEMTPTLADTLGLREVSGAVVAGVVKGGPAEQSGIRVGDVITEYDGERVADALDLPLLIARTPVAKRVSIKILRENRELELPLTIAQLPEKRVQAKTAPTPGAR